MNNFINVRLKAYHHHKEKNDISHNLQKHNKKSKYRADTEEEKTQVWREWNTENFYNYQDAEPLKILKKWREQHNDLYKKNRTKKVNGVERLRNENLTNSNSTLINGVISFSEKCSNDLGSKYSREEFETANIKAVEEMAKYLETEIMYITFHYNEKTPHCQYHLKNFDNKGNSILYKFRHTEQLEVLQDIGFKHLGKLGMERGISKKITNSNHQTTQKYYKNLYRELIKDTKELRNEIKSLELEKDKKKAIYEEITAIQKELREYKEELSIFEKISNQEKLSEEEKEVLKFLAPFLFDFIDKKDIKHKQYISNKISKALK